MEKKHTQDNMPSQDDRLIVRISLLSQAVAVLTLMVGLFFVGWMEYPSIFIFSTPQQGLEAPAAAEIVHEDRVENGLDVASGLVAEGEYLLVKRSCTGCHSGKLVTQNRASREGWLETIRWMQKTQKLWDLGPGEDKILDYLATYYAPQQKARRNPLNVEEWYMID